MSTRLPIVKEKLSRIKTMLAALKDDEGHIAGMQIRLAKVTNVILENESKIWLKTRVGEPMLMELQAAVEEAYKLLEARDPSLKGFEAALVEVERKSAKIDEESQRRSMVVT
jgi:hypothetical protein